MEYNKIYDSYFNYVDKCKKIIETTIFNKEEDSLFLTNDKSPINELIKKHRLKMIDIKVNHTMRMIDQVVKINEILGVKTDLNLAIKIAVLYHDIGRLRQATWSNTFSDVVYQRLSKPFKNHGEEGHYIFLNNDFNIEKKLIPIISQTILYHQDHYTKPKLNYHFNKNINSIEIEKIITGNFNLTEAEWQIASLIVQLVADVDKTDILYQHLSEDFDMIRDHIFDTSLNSLEEISKRWEVSKQEILEYNKMDENNYVPARIKIPIKNMPIEKLEVPKYMKNMFYDNSWPELKYLIQDKNWNFITILWWRISHFINEITFNSTLINLEESKLLEQIYEKIPNNLKPLVEEAFEYAKEVFINNTLQENKGNIYIKNKRKNNYNI